MGISIYLAGKVGKGDWRHGIVSGLRDAIEQGDYNAEWPTLRGAVLGAHDYVGPYFVSCDHGCYHGETEHGFGLSNARQWGHGGRGCTRNHFAGYHEEYVHRQCMDAIAKADLFFAWLDAPDAYGTLVELGAAYTLRRITGKPFIAVANHYDMDWDDHWFALETAQCQIPATAPAKALERAIWRSGLTLGSPLETSFWQAWYAYTDTELVPQYEFGRYRLDFAHPDSKTAIECDGFTYHSDRKRFQRDRARDRALAEAGWRTVRFASQEIIDDVDGCVQQAHRLIAANRMVAHA